MDRTEIETRTNRVIVDHLGVKPEEVKDTATLVDDLGADSLDIVELVMAFEEEFNVEITDEDAEKVSTVGDAYALVERLDGLK